MNTDSVFQIGHDHTVCEDYALAGISNKVAYAIVCDGCSASPDVDTGARFLALSAREFVPIELYQNVPDKLGKAIINHAGNTLKFQFPSVHPQALDATLLAARVDNGKLVVTMWGDGMLIHKSKHDVRWIHINVSSGAPDYLSYHLEENRKASYLRIPDNRKTATTNFNGVFDCPVLEPFVYESEILPGDVISLVSDGINSFRKSDNSEIPWESLVEEFIGFKNFTGEFALRRIAAFKRKCLKEQWTHLDDISVASIVV